MTAHPIKDQPVIIGNLVNLVVTVAGLAGVTLAEDTVTQVIAGVGALIVIGQTIAAQWGRVTPVARAEAAVAQAESAGIAQGIRSAYRGDTEYRPVPRVPSSHLGALPRLPAEVFSFTETDTYIGRS